MFSYLFICLIIFFNLNFRHYILKNHSPGPASDATLVPSVPLEKFGAHYSLVSRLVHMAVKSSAAFSQLVLPSPGRPLGPTLNLDADSANDLTEEKD